MRSLKRTKKVNIIFAIIIMGIMVGVSFFHIFNIERMNLFKDELELIVQTKQQRSILSSLILQSAFLSESQKKLFLEELKKLSASSISPTTLIHQFDKIIDKTINMKNVHYMIEMVILSTASLIFVLVSYVASQNAFLSEINTISDEFSKIDLDYLPTKHVVIYREAASLTYKVEHLSRKIELYRSVFKVSTKSTNASEFAENLIDDLKKWLDIDSLSIAELDEKQIILDVTVNESHKRVKESMIFDIKDSEEENFFLRPRILNASELTIYVEEHPLSILSLFHNKEVKSIVLVPFEIGEKERGILFLTSLETNGFDFHQMEEIEIVANAVGQVYKKIIATQKTTISVVRGFTELVEGKDEETKDHIVRMASYAKAIALELKKDNNFSGFITPKYVKQLYEQAPLHDIGKVSVPDHILRKPGKLNAEEFEKMKIHTVKGFEILRNVEREIREEIFEIGKRIARSHHERWDGKGYPDGLSGEKIPLCARIAAVADVFDALTTSRPYKEALEYQKSVNIIVHESGTHFDPRIVTAFLRAQTEIKSIYDKFNNNRI